MDEHDRVSSAKKFSPQIDLTRGLARWVIFSVLGVVVVLAGISLAFSLSVARENHRLQANIDAMQTKLDIVQFKLIELGVADIPTAADLELEYQIIPEMDRYLREVSDFLPTLTTRLDEMVEAHNDFVDAVIEGRVGGTNRFDYEAARQKARLEWAVRQLSPPTRIEVEVKRE